MSTSLQANLKTLTDEMLSANLQLYQPSETSDHLLLRWYIHLHTTNEFHPVFTNSVRPLNEFLRSFLPPHILIYHLSPSTHVIDLAAWFSPYDDGTRAAFMSYWSEPSLRGTKTHFKLSHLIYTFATTMWEIILGITSQPKILRLHRSIGYTILEPPIPAIYDGKEAYVMYLTRENFLNSKFHRIGEKHGRR